MDFHPHEVKILKALRKESTPAQVSGETGLGQDAVLRASSWLQTKKLVEVKESVSEEIRLGKEGKQYLKDGLPERQIISLVIGGADLSLVKKKLPTHIVGVGLGWLRKKNIADVKEGKITVLSGAKTDDERLLERIGDGMLNSSQLNEKEETALSLLKQRKSVVETKEVKAITIAPTKQGLKSKDSLKEGDSISQLTPEMLSSGEWRNASFRPYDVSVYVKPTYPTKKHPLGAELAKIRGIFTSMGFTEIKGPYVESAFWNFDALFTAQDHPVREMHDTFYLSNPKKVDIPGFEKLCGSVSKTHEDGWTTGSTGWEYVWDKKVAEKVVLRTHTTPVTAKYLAKLSPQDLPCKVFSLGKAFRNEAVDYKHLPEFYQVEGIVVDENSTFAHLLGILSEFYVQMGFKEVRFRPAYFPYTEMSVEPEVYFEDKGEWIELGGAGIFRPEVVKPLLGFECPVLAWGLGVDRVVALKLGLNDIRNLYVSDLDWLRKKMIK